MVEVETCFWSALWLTNASKIEEKIQQDRN